LSKLIFVTIFKKKEEARWGSSCLSPKAAWKAKIRRIVVSGRGRERKRKKGKGKGREGSKTVFKGYVS
jgi:hypothetical protein